MFPAPQPAHRPTRRQRLESAVGLKGRALWYGVAGAVGVVAVGVALLVAGYYG